LHAFEIFVAKRLGALFFGSRFLGVFFGLGGSLSLLQCFFFFLLLEFLGLFFFSLFFFLFRLLFI
jgi:hypothetical protein